VQRHEKQILLDTLVGGIAHELNNKLTPVLGFTGLLAPSATGPERTYLSHITQSVAEAAAIIRQLLQLSKPQTGEQDFMNLTKAVEEALVMLKFEIRESGTATRVEKPAEPIMILGVHGQIKQVIINLALNAIQAMERQPVKTLTITVGREADSACISVRDTGTGIIPEILGRIFDPFFTTKGPDRGSGLGLSICFSIMRQHGGDLTVESEPGHGACFKATFPLALNLSSAGSRPSAPSQSGRRPPMPAPRHRVLVVEDEAVVRRLVQETIRRHFGCTVETATNGLQGLQQAETGPYDLVISDIRMPEMNGPELYRRLRDSQPALAERFVFITGHPGSNEDVPEVAQWPVPVVAKPFSVERLVEVCTPYLQPRAPD
jgi:CheY-like chemotaxis protein/anti-sigma regulatory factor (Ser/Thr protein kinase)